jgi:predicted GH43/DUF377 family glycosyl hydrolase
MYLMESDMLHFWHSKSLVLRPTFPWEYVQIGNCGSPIETPAGWLVLTHGVGPMRKYSIGAVLLDRDDPTRVLGRLPQPLLSADENERVGYVPNVVYSCGAAVQRRTARDPLLDERPHHELRDGAAGRRARRAPWRVTARGPHPGFPA